MKVASRDREWLAGQRHGRGKVRGPPRSVEAQPAIHKGGQRVCMKGVSEFWVVMGNKRHSLG